MKHFLRVMSICEADILAATDILSFVSQLFLILVKHMSNFPKIIIRIPYLCVFFSSFRGY
jgi:hypothetical protein